MTTLVIATKNRHKVQEIQAVLSEGFKVYSLELFPGAPELREDAGTFAGNATQKAVALANWLSGLRMDPIGGTAPVHEVQFVLADDSGLEVDCLGGAPGVRSARFAAEEGNAAGNSSDAANNAKLLRLLNGVPWEKRTARFRCVLALTPVPVSQTETSSPVCYADEAELQTELFEGWCEGHIREKPSGSGGFGYDPLFVPKGYDRSFAELGEEVKNRISHRAEALRKLKRRFNTP